MLTSSLVMGLKTALSVGDRAWIPSIKVSLGFLNHPLLLRSLTPNTCSFLSGPAIWLFQRGLKVSLGTVGGTEAVTLLTLTFLKWRALFGADTDGRSRYIWRLVGLGADLGLADEGFMDAHGFERPP